MRLFYFILSFTFLLGNVRAGQPYFNHFTIESGITNNQVFNIIQDDLGYIWFGTLNGLNRYNGNGFDTFFPSSQEEGHLKGNIIQNLYKGKKGNIWAVTRNYSLNFYNAERQKFQQFPDSTFPFHQTSIKNIIEDTNGNIRFTVNRKYFILKVKEQKVYPILPDKTILRQFEYAEDLLWLLTPKGILFYDLKKEKLIPAYDEIYQLKNIIALAQDPVLGIYILTDKGIFYFNDKSLKVKNIINFDLYPQYFKNRDRLNDFVYDGKSFWIKYNNRLYHVSKEQSNYKIQPIKDNPFNKTAFHGIAVTDILVDKSLNTWVTTDKHGINLFNQRKNQFQHYYPYNLKNNLKELNPVRAIHETKDGRIWVGFENLGLGYYNSSQTEFHLLDLGKNDIGSVRSIFEDSQGTLWIGTRKNIYIFNRQTQKLETLKKAWNINWSFHVYTIKEDKKGRVWLGGAKLGVIQLSDKSTQLIKLKGNISVIRDIDFDFKNNNVWIASDANGLFKYNPISKEQTQFKASNKASSIIDNKVYNICVQDDIIWTGTNSGLSQINLQTGHIHNFTQKDGLSSDVIYGICSDENQNLWISTAKGINYFDKEKKHFIKYLMNHFFLDDAISQHTNKKVYFGGYNGFVSFCPKDIKPISTEQKPVLEEMYLFGKKVVTDSNSVLKKALTHTQSIILDHTQNTFSFVLNSMPANSSRLMSYQYKLEGFQSNWINTFEGGNRAEFTQVPSGKYTLKVRSRNIEGEWSKHETTLKVIITPPFWQTAFFKVAVVVLIILLIYSIIKGRERNIKQRNRLLQSEVNAKTKELREQNTEILKQKEEIEKMSEKVHEADQAKLRFFTNISHEFKTPLTLIIGHLDMMKDVNKIGANTSFQTVRRNALKLIELVNDIVDFRKTSQGEQKLSASAHNIIPLIQTIVNDFHASAKFKQIDIKFMPIQEEIILWIDRKKFDKVINNLISNAIKYTPKNGAISIEIEDSIDNVYIHIIDTGIGIEEAEQDKVFQRFYRSSSDHEAIGHGIGLALVKAFVELHKGEISLKSRVGEGSHFSVKFIKGKAHLPEENLTVHKTEDTYKTKTTKELPVTFQKSDIELTKTGVPSLLIVEDNPELLTYICDLLTENYSIQTATNGIKALAKLEDNTFDLILSDIMMPEMDGITFCQKAKKDIRFSHIPFILLTAKSDIETKLQGFQLGIDDYIDKPFNPELIKVRINTLLNNRERLKAELQKGSLIDTEQHKMSSPDKVFLEKVWQILAKNYHEPNFSVDFLGKEIGMSRATFFRKFKGLTGQSPIDFIKNFRIKKAGTLIKSGDYAIAEVCTMVGYKSPSQFRKAFKEVFNVSPSEYGREG